MDSNYRPQSPDLSSYAPQSPDLSGFQPPDHNLPSSHSSIYYSGFGQNPAFSSDQNLGYGQSASTAGGFQGSAYPGNNANSNHNNGFGSHFSHQAPTSIPQLPEPAYQQQQQQQAYHQQQQQQPQQYIPPGMMAQQQQYQPYPPQQSHYQQPQFFKHEDNDPDYNPHAAPAPTPNKRTRRPKQEPSYNMPGNSGFGAHSSYEMNRPGVPAVQVKSEPLPDPTLGCQLRTTFPVARIKRLMQADEDIGKVAQVTPTVVSRALELFMIKLISASAMQARGGATATAAAAALGGAKAGAAGTPAAPPSSSGPKRILVQHLKKAVLADDTFDFLREIVDKVPDAPAKGKREGGGGGGGGGGAGSDSEDGGAATKAKKRGKRRKDSGDDF
jgi:hypothetical protein